MFTISIINEGVESCVILEGRFDTLNSNLFNEKIQGLLEEEDYLILDFTKCSYLASTGIRSLISAAKTLNKKGGALILAGLSPEVFQVLEMAGLHTVFHLFNDINAGREEICRLKKKASSVTEMSAGDNLYQVEIIYTPCQPTLIWKHKDLAGCNELPVSLGMGSAAESLIEEVENKGLFLTIGNSSGFIPFDATQPPEFRVLKDSATGGIYLDWAVSFGHHPGKRISLLNPSEINVEQLLSDSLQIPLAKQHEKLLAVAIADFSDSSPSISLFFLSDQQNSTLLQSGIPEQLNGFIKVSKENRQYLGAGFLLNQLPDILPGESFHEFAHRILQIENIEEAVLPDLSAKLSRPVAWLFYGEDVTEAESRRIKVETATNFVFEPYKAFLTRRLYSDSARVVVKQLHGGYSAQTFQVDSYDHHGRKLRPTVLKIANRDIISREADRCQKFSLPYIMNNSAMVLGTAFYCDTGALRYNFVGIGGEQTQLKWLTHYFNTWSVGELEPLFDKIFQQILRPWYGQPVKENIFLYRDHDPTLTFFPRLCETAAELFSISTDDKYFHIEETNQDRINPYWFLKHEFKARREQLTAYYTSICHGDLNMQNILLDKEMNVYLIDFSETRPRSVVSDFARLEAIFMIEHSPDDKPEDLTEAIKFTSRFYDTVHLDSLPDPQWDGESSDIMKRNLALTLKMRKYAIACTSGENSIVPYYMALLEWILPVVCYGSASFAHKKLSACVAGLLCEKIMECDPLPR